MTTPDGRTAPTVRLGPLALQLGLVAIMAFAAAMVFANSFRRTDLVVPLLVATVVPCAVQLLGARLLRRPLATVAASFGLLVLWLAAWTSGQEGWPVTPLLEIVVDGPARILTSSIPAPATAALLGVPATMAWIACMLAGQFVVRSDSSLLPALPPVVVLVLGGLFASEGLGWEPEVAWIVVATALLLAALRSWWDERGAVEATIAAVHDDGSGDDGDQATSTPGAGGADRALRRRALQVTVLVAVLTVLAGVLVPRLPGVGDRDRTDLRDRFELTPEVPLATSPLDVLAASYVDDPRTEIDERDRLMVTVTGESGIPVTVTNRGDRVVRITKTALDRYDGARWVDQHTYRAAGTPLPPDPDAVATAPVESHVLDVELHAVDGIWLPTVGRANEISPRSGIADAAVDPLTGALITRDGVPAAGARYRIETTTTQLGDPTERRLAPALPPSGPATAIGLGDSDLSAQLERLDEVAAAATPGLAFTEQVNALEALLWNEVRPEAQAGLAAIRLDDLDFRFVGPETIDASQGADDDSDQAIGKSVPTGHSLERILRFLYTPNEEDQLALRRGLGTPEQFATAFVLLARSQGIPARVVVGYTVPVEEDSPTRVEALARHADAWPEVYSANLGWVAFDPTPPDLGEQVSRSDLDATTTTAVTTAPTSAAPPPPTVVLDDGSTGADDGSGTSFLLAVLSLLAVVAIVLLLLPTIVTARRRRSRRRLDPAAAVAGAWEDTAEHLLSCGVPLDPSMTAAQATEVTRGALGDATGAATGRLAAHVERAACGIDPPDVEDAGRAWSTADEVRRNATRTLNGRAKLRARLDLGSARRYRRRIESARRDLQRPLGPKDLIGSPHTDDLPLGIDLRLPSDAGSLRHPEGGTEEGLPTGAEPTNPPSPAVPTRR